MQNPGLKCVAPRREMCRTQVWNVSNPGVKCVEPRREMCRTQAWNVSNPGLKCVEPRPEMCRTQAWYVSNPDLKCVALCVKMCLTQCFVSYSVQPSALCHIVSNPVLCVIVCPIQCFVSCCVQPSALCQNVSNPVLCAKICPTQCQKSVDQTQAQVIAQSCRTRVRNVWSKIIRSISVTLVDTMFTRSMAVYRQCPWVLFYYSDLTLSESFQPMAAQLSNKAALPLAKILATASCRSSKTGPWVASCCLYDLRQQSESDPLSSPLGGWLGWESASCIYVWASLQRP